MSLRKSFFLTLLSAALLTPLSAQTNRGQTDSVVVLMNAKLMEQFESDGGEHFRRAIEARFLHNNTYLVCDSALWNVDQRIINAFGHVQIIQDRTVLSSDRLDYLIDDDLAQFRGTLVQLQDKDGNTLRTRYLDYNTKDSVAVFERGGSMRDRDGQIIESKTGTYESKNKVFYFEREVNMYTDSVYISTHGLMYHTDSDVADFYGGLNAWKGKNMISSETGYYDKGHDRFFFTRDVHMMSNTQEGWSDSLYFDRSRNDLEMYGNVQVTDSTRNVSALSERLFYVDSLSRVTLQRNATVIAETDQGGTRDTVYMGADSMVYRTVQKCDIDGNIIDVAQKRLDDLSVDPLAAYRTTSSSESQKDSGEELPEAGGRMAGRELQAQEESEAEPEPEPEIAGLAGDPSEAPLDSLMIDRDSLRPLGAGLDSLVVQAEPQIDSVAMAEQRRLDSIAARSLFVADSLNSRDTTEIGFLTALGHIRIFKSDMQARCDSLEYCDLDSLARLFISPIVWNEGNRQYTSDSLTVSVKNQRMDKANLMSNAFIIIQEDSICFDQIKGAEIMAYFDSTTVLRRFDALGGSSALFYLKENDAFATVNKVEAKVISANFVEGELDRIYYYDNPKNDAYPVVQLPPEEKEMKGFSWQPQLRPTGKEDITSLELKPSERLRYLAKPMPSFEETDRYFPGHMKNIAAKLAAADSLRRVRHAEERERQAEREAALAVTTDSLSVSAADSLVFAAGIEEGEKETPAGGPEETSGIPEESRGLAEGPSVDMGAAADSLHMGTEEEETYEEPAPESSPEELKALEAARKAAEKAARKEEAEAKRKARSEAREARWAEMDARDAAKAAAKEAKALEKKRKNTLRMVLTAQKDAARDQKRLEKYIRKYEKKKARRDARKKDKQEEIQ
jgi:hypothetical protein